MAAPRPLYLVDAFSHGPFTGNPAAVCILDGPAPDDWMQAVAMEMNQAETAFVYPVEGNFSLRWFTPLVEVDLCGHATLAAARVLFDRGYAEPTIRFDTRSGILTAEQHGVEIELDFPAEAPVAEELPCTLSFLGADPVWTGRNRMDWFVQLPTEADIHALAPNFAEIAGQGLRGLIVTAKADTDYDFVSRGFFPQSGIDEDPATGSAHCALGPFWALRLGKDDLLGFQASRRGGKIGVTIRGDRVRLRGQAVTTMEGSLLAVP